MNDQLTPTGQPDEEYQFSLEDEQPAAASFTAAPSKASIFERIKRKNVLIALGAIAVIFSIYKLVDVLFMSSTPNRVARSAITAQLPTTNTTSAVPASTTSLMPAEKPVISDMNTQPPVASVAGNKFDDRLTALEGQSTDVQAKLDQLTSQLADMQNSVSSLGSQVSSLNDSMQALNVQFAKQQTQQQEAKKKLTHQKVNKTPQPIYYVRAMIPGRAWLVTEGGGTITAAVGDKLPGYGIVQVIDATQGTLTTSTGAIISYNPDDS